MQYQGTVDTAECNSWYRTLLVSATPCVQLMGLDVSRLQCHAILVQGQNSMSHHHAATMHSHCGAMASQDTVQLVHYQGHLAMLHFAATAALICCCRPCMCVSHPFCNGCRPNKLCAV